MGYLLGIVVIVWGVCLIFGYLDPAGWDGIDQSDDHGSPNWPAQTRVHAYRRFLQVQVPKMRYIPQAISATPNRDSLDMSQVGAFRTASSMQTIPTLRPKNVKRTCFWPFGTPGFGNLCGHGSSPQSGAPI